MRSMSALNGSGEVLETSQECVFRFRLGTVAEQTDAVDLAGRPDT
jgi:hypothetical protein